ncbi:MAG TPA: MYXO-CTERM sorting domain-containing protein [Kofleriaceae bacterium]|nr:MYXO-CTERM sorting domain-containing protein [Kofleriaceae bacterium]
MGPGKPYAGIADATPHAQPGDVIEVQGGSTYPGMIWLRDDTGGTKDKPVTIRGIKVDGKRPVLSGVGSGPDDNIILLLNANHVVMESFEVIGDGGDTNYCVVHKADDVTLRDFVIHNCLHQGGLVGTDEDSGSLTVEYSEFYHNGNGTNSHQIYMTTDENTYPGSVFRIQFCYVHDGVGGNNVRSRAERNEIYYNWIEGAFYHELDLIGPIDGDSLPFREDSDIVGNVLIKKNSEFRIARLGGDGDGNTGGRYRFSNNTMVMTDSSTTVISLQNTVQSLEMYNNVIYGSKAGFDVYDVDEQIGPDAAHFGANNWVLTGTTSIPTTWIGTLTGTDPGFVDLANEDLRPKMSSPLVDKGTTLTVSTGSLGFPRALLMPTYHPPQHLLLAIGMGDGRNNQGAPDIGAFEANASAPGAPPQSPPPEMIGNQDMGGGCGCHSTGSPSGVLLWFGLGAAVLRRSRRRRRR